LLYNKMICILSPAKTMVTANAVAATAALTERSSPVFHQQAETLGAILKNQTKKQLKDLCGVSDALSAHVKNIYHNVRLGDDSFADTTRYNQAALMFDGPAFRGTI
jgi:cytoplasmic iron level regulating protein YaaA (DUF328/UPF0246 family)